MKNQILYYCLIMQICCISPVLWAEEQDAGESEGAFPEYSAPPFEDFSAMIQRPLFLSTRRPASVIKPPPTRRIIPKRKVEVKTINLLLSGVIHDGEEYIALVRKGKKGEMVQLKKNKMIDGWRLLEIKPEEITLNKGANFTTVRLRDNKPVVDDKKRAQRASKIRLEKLRKARLLRNKKKAARRLANKER